MTTDDATVQHNHVICSSSPSIYKLRPHTKLVLTPKI